MDEHGHFTIDVTITHALWPGDGVFCTRISSSVFKADLFQLVDRNDRISELRPYRVGMDLLDLGHVQ